MSSIDYFNNNIFTSGTVTANSGNFNTLRSNGILVSVSGHSHFSSDIADFNTSISGLLPVVSVSGSGYVNVVNSNKNFIVSVSGLQPSGNYSVVGHSHSSSDITDFNSSVSGLLNYATTSVSGIVVLSNTIDQTENKALTPKALDDAFGTSLVGGSGISIIYDSSEDELSINLTSHTHTVSNISDFNSSVSGLLPTISNSGDNRVLTSVGTSLGINAESSFTFNGSILSHNAGNFATNGDAQHNMLVVRRTTTDATANVVLTLDGDTPGASNRITVPAQTTWTFSLKLSAYNNTDNIGAWWIIRGGIRRNAANGTVLVGNLIMENDSEGSMSGASATVVADDTNEALEIRVTGLNSKNIRWVGVLDISQVSYAS